jgi:purine nucleosidase
MAQNIPVLLDTDIGSDIDDALALSYLLKEPRCELLGITTVTGDVAQRAGCADVICRTLNRTDVPIHCGASNVLWIGPGQPTVPQFEFIRDLPQRKEWPTNTAVDFLRRTIRNRPGEITLLTIGPLTNIALLFAVDPEIPSLLRGMVSMAGVFFREGTKLEWNCLVDPIATAMVFRARPPGHVCIGLDVTLKCVMSAAQARRRFAPPPLTVVTQMAETWFSKSWDFTFHDPLAAAILFHPELCTYEDGEVNLVIDPAAEKTGETRLTPVQGKAPHRVAREVKVDEFFNEFFSVF